MAKTLTINGHLVRSVTLAGANVKAIGDGVNTLWEQAQPDYFYFEDRSGEANAISITKTGDIEEWLVLEYSTDKSTWTTWDFSQTIALPANGKVYLRGNNQKFSVSGNNYHNFGSTGNVYAGGSVISLFNKNVPQIIDSNATMFGFMFFGMTTLVGVDTNLFSGINYGSSGSWRDTTNMFYKTFSGCSSLVTPPDLSGLGYAKGSTFRETFGNCDLLESAAPMNVTEIDTSSANQFRTMYYHCFALTDASPLRIGFSTSVQYTFYQMFPDDRILATAPDLTSITTLGNQSMRLMFYNCKPLDVVKIGISAWGDFEDSTAADYNATYQWLSGVHSTGVFCKNSTLPVTRGVNYIPNNWSIADLNGKLYAPVITNNNGTITIAEAEGGDSCQIWYTTDGTTPTTNSTLYTQPFAVAAGTTVKAIAHYNGQSAALVTDSDVTTYTV